MSTELDEVGKWLIQILYNNWDSEKYVSSNNISSILEFDELKVVNCLNQLIESELVEREGSGYKLSEKGYAVVFQRDSSYCPHL